MYFNSYIIMELKIKLLINTGLELEFKVFLTQMGKTFNSNVFTFQYIRLIKKRYRKFNKLTLTQILKQS
jgi:hypothetical protein